MDQGHRQTDQMLISLEKKLNREYNSARKTVENKLTGYLEKFKEQDAEKAEKVKNGLISQEDYAKWRMNKMATSKRWRDMRDVLAKDLSNANQIAMGIINNHAVDVYALNANYGSYEVCKGTNLNLSFSLYDHATVERLMRDNPEIIPKARVDIPKDLRWNRAKLTSAITQGILTGESIPDIARRLRGVTDMNRSAAIRNARTYTTAAENGGRVDSYKRAEEMGIDLKQEWMSTLDMRTRSSHRHMDGEKTKIGEKFSNGLRYPGDPDGPPWEIYNCRCTLVAAINGFDDSAAQRFSRLPDGMSYEEWKSMKKNKNGEAVYRQFKNGEEANEYFGKRPERSLRKQNREEYDRQLEAYKNSAFGKWYEELNSEQMLSIGSYSGDGYSGINGLLRHQMTERMVDSWNSTERISIQDMINNIDGAINNFELKEPIKVFRTCENDVLKNLNLVQGASFHDDGFVSTSVINKKVASGNVVMQINVPAGKGYGAWINPLSGAEDEEYEFLLQRGSDFIVRSVKTEGSDTIVELDLIGNTKKDWSYASKEEVIKRWKEDGIYDEYNAQRI